MKYFLTLSAALSLLPSVYAGLEDAKFSTVLTPNNFDNVIASQSEGTLVAFFAPWCGHCKNLEGTWSKIAEAFDGDDRCKVAHLNADEAAARPISSRYGVSGFPTLKFLEPPSKGGGVDTYNGARTEEAFLEYLNEKCGTQKGKGGILSDVAGRIPSLDNLAAAYLSPSSPRSSILASASSLSSSLSTRSSEMSAYYLKLMTKWSQLAEDNVEEAKKWIEGESQRLGKMVSKGKGKVQRGKLEEMKMKQNILSVFASATSYASQASATASSIASSASSSLSSQATVASSSISSAANVGSSSISSAGSVVSSSASSVATGASKSASSVASGVSASVKSVVGGGGAEKSASSISSEGSKGASQAASTVSSVAAKVTDRVKEEL